MKSGSAFISFGARRAVLWKGRAACCLPVLLPGAGITCAAAGASLEKSGVPLHITPMCIKRQLCPPGKPGAQAEEGPGNLVVSQWARPVCLENMNKMQ